MVGAIIVSRVANLAAHGVSVIGYIPRGLPAFGLPALGLHDTVALLGTAASIFIVILAQSAATARAYAARYGEPFGTDTDLVGLGAGNIAAAFTGTFVVNGSPDQDPDRGRRRRAQPAGLAHHQRAGPRSSC